jgi:hypothetical protein
MVYDGAQAQMYMDALRSALMSVEEFRVRMNCLYAAVANVSRSTRHVDCGSFALAIVPDWGQQ